MHRHGLFIGRFQPFHHGHLYALKKGLVIVDVITIAIGSASAPESEYNPLNYKQRKNIIKKVLRHEKLTQHVPTIVASNDYPRNKDWLDEIYRRVQPFCLVITNNQLVNDIFNQAGITVYNPGFYQREQLEGTLLRKRLKNNCSIHELVPQYLSSYCHAHLPKILRKYAGA